MLLGTPTSPNEILARLGRALRRARRLRGHDNSDDFGKAAGVSGRTLREMEAKGKSSTENLVRVLQILGPQVLEDFLQSIESIEPAFSSVEEALAKSPNSTKGPNQKANKEPNKKSNTRRDNE